MVFGVESSGFVQKTLTDIQGEIEADQRALYGPNVNQSATSLLGQLNGIVAAKLAEMWELANGVYRAQYPESASGDALDQVCSITGVQRLPATKSTVTLSCTGTPATSLPLGRIASVSGTAASRFKTTAAATIAAATAWAPTTGYLVGDIRTNSSKIYRCITAGTSAGAGGPSGTSTDITDNTAHWRYLGDGTGYVTVAAESEIVTGPVAGNAFSVTVIETAVTGWNNVTNLLDAVLGRNLETDAELRKRRDAQLRVTGDATVEALRADVRAVSGVSQAFVFENTTMATDVDGVPAKAFEVVVLGGADADLRAAIWASKPAGIESYGSTSGSITDSQGFSHTVKFSRPTSKNVWVIANVTTDPAKFPSDGMTQIQNMIKAYGDALTVGDDVIQTAIIPGIFEVSGVLDVTSLLIGFSSPPTLPNNLTIASRELAVFDTSRITVNVS